MITTDSYNNRTFDYRSVCERAAALVFGDRGEDYGHPMPECALIADLWSAYKGVEFEPGEIPIFMILLKIARETYKHKEDNLVDIAGYAEVCNRVVAAQKAREAPPLPEADPMAPACESCGSVQGLLFVGPAGGKLRCICRACKEGDITNR